MTPYSAHTIFCDDIRQEVGNKLAFLGVYRSFLFCHEIPVTLPKLCVATYVSLPLDCEAESVRLKVVKLMNGSEVGELASTESALTAVSKDRIAGLSSFGVQPRRQHLFLLTLQGYKVDCEHAIRVKVYVGSEEFSGGALLITKPESEV